MTGSSGCPKACDPHDNRCDATAPTCIFPAPRVASPRGACACRPGYKAANCASNDISKQWRLPVEGHEHRVWVAEDVKRDTSCEVSTGVNTCLEVPLIGKERVGVGRNASYQSVPVFEGGSGSYSRPLSTATSQSATNYLDELTTATGIVTDDFDDFEAKTDTALTTLATSSDELEGLDAAAAEFSNNFDAAAMSPEESENPPHPDDGLDDFDETTPSPDGASPFSAGLPTGELNDIPTTGEDPPLPDFLSTPSLEARQAEETTASKNYWAKVAQQQGLEFLEKLGAHILADLPRLSKALTWPGSPDCVPLLLVR
ncbi:hypothetical protein LTR22_026055 [Elasticomyces elasticus]|nr:hypothetical protein LTR22_026055 [Elasticomyces elasticus]